MKYTFYTILILLLIGGLVTGLYSLFFEFSIESFIYIAVEAPWLLLVPTVAGVLLFRLIKRFFFPTKSNLLKLACIVALLLITGLSIWIACDVMIDKKPLNTTNITSELNTQFLGFIPAGLIMAMLLPYVDCIIRKKQAG